MITTLKELSQADYEYRKAKFPSFEKVAGYHKSYSDKTANRLTAAIKRWLELSGGAISRTNSQGQYDPKLKRIRYSGSTKGQADINCAYKGRSVQIEIKIGKDRQSLVQKEFQRNFENAGAFYFIVRTWEDFISQISKVS
jgi:hypothetical protein